MGKSKVSGLLERPNARWGTMSCWVSRFQVGLLLDTKGPEVRSGDVIDKIPLQAGDDFTFTIDRTSVIDPLVEKKVTVNYDGFLDDVQVNDVLLVDGGMLSLQVRARGRVSAESKTAESERKKDERNLIVCE